MANISITNQRVLLWLVCNEVTPHKQHILLDQYKEPTDIWHNFEKDREHLSRLLTDGIYQKLKNSKSSDELKKLILKIDSFGVKIVTVFDSEYPLGLKQPAVNAPTILFFKGDINILGTPCLAVVGTRTPSDYGRTQCYDIVKGVAENGITIVSGLAGGIDSVAHKAALDAKGKTIAVLGSGHAHITPVFNHKLAEEIIDRGLIISEYPPYKLGAKYTFPQRNRLISGVSQGVFIVEAAKKSGALITADFALEQDRDVFALCGNANSHFSSGTNNLIRQGNAKLTTSAFEILEDMGYGGDKKDKKSCPLVLDIFEEKIYTLLSLEALSFDKLIEKTGSDPKKLNQLLCTMELKGIIKKLSQNHYSI